MPIKVLSLDLLTHENLSLITNYYNTYRPKDLERIELFEFKKYSDNKTSDYGFRIRSRQINSIYSNSTYKYMRWQMKTLTSIYNFPPFSYEEEVLLFRIMGGVLGKEHVSYYRTYDQAIKHSPSFNHTVFSNLLTRSPVPESIRTDGVIASKEGNILSRVAVDISDLSLSANAGWKYPRIRI